MLLRKTLILIYVHFNMSKDGRGNFRSSCRCKRFVVSYVDLVSLWLIAHTALYLPKLVKSHGKESQEQSRARPTPQQDAAAAH